VAKKTKPVIEQDTKERLIQAAKEVFFQRGFEGATVKEIVERAGVNVSLVSYHFKGKEGLFRACLEKFGAERLHDAEQILTPPESAEDLRAKLKLWMHQFLQCHAEDNKICGIIHRENLAEHTFMWDIFEGTFLKTFLAMQKFFEGARRKNIVQKNIDPALVAALVFGSLIHLGRNQDIQRKVMGVSIQDAKYRSHVADQFVAMILNGII
jgi:AcrR family transcriptional regulator